MEEHRFKTKNFEPTRGSKVAPCCRTGRRWKVARSGGKPFGLRARLLSISLNSGTRPNDGIWISAGWEMLRRKTLLIINCSVDRRDVILQNLWRNSPHFIEAEVSSKFA